MRKSLLFMVLFSIIISTGCSATNKEIKAVGKSENWDISITYKWEKNMLYNDGKVVYLNDNPPKKIKFEYSYPSGFPSRLSGTIDHYDEKINVFKFGGGSGSINEGDNFENLKEKIDKMSILIQWETDGKVYNETVDLNVME